MIVLDILSPSNFNSASLQKRALVHEVLSWPTFQNGEMQWKMRMRKKKRRKSLNKNLKRVT